ncbi:MAG: c-type cytochrome, partial [Burkholderiales bacterium]|nr:c-type cytochrome [Burkholderiales bacterium]
GAVNMEKAIAERIQKIGAVEIRDANRQLKTGEEVFKAQCSACHMSGAAGAPKFGDAAAWAPRVKTGYESLLTSAVKGKGAMGAQGGGDLETLEIGRAVVYLANGSGGKFDEPKAAPAAEPAK